ncbi:hypothetical protein [Hyphomicrobium sp. CS1GBMeth3]|uniref:hypothetical protein n=1 Tax=Hyphomicrobium sp. CS1GBMeth3 TaxID=1892845 RepID=UPI0009308B4B|nr:hypothetical protein [Hyphomicrobium sp. CS1GBMeth3]
MTELNRTHAALFDELERQGIYWADVVKHTQAALAAQTIIASAHGSACGVEPYQRCETCE